MGERLLIPGTRDYSNIRTTTGGTTTKKSTSNQSRPATKVANSKNNMIQTAAARVSDKPSVQEQQTALQCPRCDSSNTKFCYYNNYSLSQPRHFCKACKRYWTRGGTLRNVPVGGVCRKNKRIKKTAAAASATATGAVSGVINNRHDLLAVNPLASLSIQPATTSACHVDASLLYALQSSCAMSLAVPDFGSSAQIPSIVATAFDLQKHLSALELGFSTAQCNNEYQLGYQDQYIPQVNSEVLPLQMADGSINSAASLLVSNLKQSNKAENYQSLLPYEDLHAFGMDLRMFKDVKLEGKHGGNLINSSSCSDQYQWQIPSEINTSTTGAFGFGAFNCFNASADDSYCQLSWNTVAGGGWPEVSSYGSSVAPPLI